MNFTLVLDFQMTPQLESWSIPRRPQAEDSFPWKPQVSRLRF